tara:strand:+ start:179 stop:499 length:321 start_codon:yes stop_codon:yes gene_type:complete
MRNTELIYQELEVKEWPLLKVGDEKFFGYVLSMGVMPNDFCEVREFNDMRQYVDFGYRDGYERYILPNNKKLRKDLLRYLWDNMEVEVYSKLWIYKLENGYKVDLP